MSNTVPTFNAPSTGCALPLPTGGTITPVKTTPVRPNASGAERIKAEAPAMQYSMNGVKVG